MDVTFLESKTYFSTPNIEGHDGDALVEIDDNLAKVKKAKYLIANHVSSQRLLDQPKVPSKIQEALKDLKWV
ncbi:hypothetical protein CR513_52551, partial [Mucuna pruriens]